MSDQNTVRQLCCPIRYLCRQKPLLFCWSVQWGSYFYLWNPYTKYIFTKLSALCHESIISILIIQMFCLTIKRFRFCCTTIAWTWNVRLSTLLQFIQEDISFRILLLKSSWLTEVSPWNLFEKYIQHVILGFISRVRKVGFRRYGLLRGEPIDWGIQSRKEGWNAKPWSSF